MELWITLTMLAALFAGSLALAFVVHQLGPRSVRKLQIADGTVLRLRGPKGIYRTRVVRETPSGWSISAPLQRDAYVPLRPGEPFSVEAAIEGGVLVFQTEIASRDIDEHTVEIERPRSWFTSDRREEPRRKALEEVEVLVDGLDATLIDLSSGGAKLLTTARIARGERVHLEFAGRGLACAGWVLDSHPLYKNCEPCTEVRLRFEAPVNPLLMLA